MTPPLSRLLTAALLLALPLVGCDGGDKATPGKQGGAPAGEADPEAQRLRELAAVYFEKDSRPNAREALRPLIERADPAPRDLIAAACIELKEGKSGPARELLERARSLGDDSPELAFNLARVAYYDAEFGEATRLLEGLHEQLPEDLPLSLFLAQMLEEVALEGEAGRLAEAEALYRGVYARGIESGASWYLLATYRLAQLLQRSDREDQANPYFEEYDRLRASGLSVPQPAQVEEGSLGRLSSPRPQGSQPRGPGDLPATAGAHTLVAQAAGMQNFLVADVDDDCRLDLLLWGPAGMAVLQQGEDFAWQWRPLVEGPVDLALAFDIDVPGSSERDLDLLYAQGQQVKLLRSRRGPGGSGPLEWTPWDRELPALPSVPRDVVALDYDHEGDLDLVLVGDFGARLWRNDGAGAAQAVGVFSDVSTECGLPRNGSYAWCTPEDLDTDQDIDLLLGGPAGLYLASNERRGLFSDQSARLKSVGLRKDRPLIADLDGDARPDLWFADQLFMALPGGGYAAGMVSVHQPVAPPAGAALSSADLDLDGSLDVYWTDAGVLHGRLSVGLEVARPFQRELEGVADLLSARYTDLDSDLGQELVLLSAEGLELRRGTPSGKAVRLFYRGSKDNQRAIGAVIELRAGGVYRRIFGRGLPELVGLGGESEVDYVRIQWPNGTRQIDLRHNLGDRSCDTEGVDAFQPEGLMGSCPFLYTWNGETYEFISDVLGITPLGLPMAPGMLVPPDHDEYVLVRGEQLTPRDGVLELQFTEELREVTYLDRIRLDVIDHPANTQVYPNERFCFPPFPDDTIHMISASHAPVSAVGSDGRDWTAQLARVDGDHAVPFENAPSQMLGLASPHFLELEFDREQVANAAQLRLLMTGWFYWTDASVNMASARDPRFEFVPPILQVPDGQGGWRDAGPPVGFPAGKTKTMVLDVGSILLREDPRLRIFSTLRLYWDEIHLATDAGRAPIARHSLEPDSALLWRRGFSAPQVRELDDQPERFVWGELAQHPRWNPHPGRYTRLGEVVPLLGEIDDRYAILASGDALTVRFDATALPPVPEGWRRDYLVFLDGWAKDRDPNTHEALYVEPLPFHGMSGYPYGSDEHFPDDAAHRAWRREWNTRDAEPWIPFQAPERQP